MFLNSSVFDRVPFRGPDGWNILPFQYDIEFLTSNGTIIRGNRQLLKQSCYTFREILSDNPQTVIKMEFMPTLEFEMIVAFIMAHENFFGLHPVFPTDFNIPNFTHEVFRLSNILDIPIIKEYMLYALVDNVNLTNVIYLLKLAHANNFEELKEACLVGIDLQAKEFIQRQLYLDLNYFMIVEILDRDSFYTAEINVLLMCLIWCGRNSPHSLKDILAHIRFAFIDSEQLHTKILSTQCSTPNAMQEVQEISKAIKVQLRQLEQDRKFNTKRFKAVKVLNGKNLKFCVLLGEVSTALNELNVSHKIGERDACILVELRNHYLINHIIIRFFDQCDEYKYYVEVSNDNEHWKRVIDYSSYLCDDVQELFFPIQPVKYVKFVGLGSLHNEKFFRLSRIYFSYMQNFCKTINNGVLQPISYRCMGLCMLGFVYPLHQPVNLHTLCIYTSKKIPIKLRVETSVDGKNWEHALEKTIKKEDLSVLDEGTYIKFKFPARICMFYRISEV